MKTMTCNQLAGACDKEFHAETFEELAQISKQHGMEMFQAGDEAHLKAMGQMMEKMSDPKQLQEWMDKKREEFDSLPANN